MLTPRLKSELGPARLGRPAARILALKGFRMGRFNLVGTTTTVARTVSAVDLVSGEVTVTMACADADGITVGPGHLVLQLPHAKSQAAQAASY